MNIRHCTMEHLEEYGRTFEINDLAVDPLYQKRGIATTLLKQCLSDLKQQGISGGHHWWPPVNLKRSRG